MRSAKALAWATAATVNRGLIVDCLGEARDDNATSASVQRSTISIIVEKVHNGRFLARLNDTGRLIVASSRRPFVDSARRLIEQGHDPNCTLEMWAVGGVAFALRARIGAAARLMVLETEHGPAFKSYRGTTDYDGPEAPQIRLDRPPVAPRAAAGVRRPAGVARTYGAGAS